MWRLIVLLAGPVLLTWASYAMTVGRAISEATQPRESTASASSEFDVRSLRDAADTGLASPAASKSEADRLRKLAVACDRRATQLTEKLEPSFRIIVRPPFVIVGDVSVAALDQHYRETILPTSRALSLMYFDHPPDEPISILLFATEKAYQQTAKRFDDRSTANYHGYYIRTDRRVMLNASTGSGTLSHELTHALGHFDFPAMPEWFDEGLASLYEECSFTSDGLQLVGHSNWRLNHLLNAMHRRKLDSLEALLGARKFRSERQEIDYAQARYLCLYLQERNVLPLFYRKFRANSATDPSGMQTLREVFAQTSLDPIDRDFRNWSIDLYEQSRKVASRR